MSAISFMAKFTDPKILKELRGSRTNSRVLNRQCNERRPSILHKSILIRGRGARLGVIVCQRYVARVVVRSGEAADALVHGAVGVVDREVEGTGADIAQIGGLRIDLLSHAEAGDPEGGRREGC